LGRESQFQYSDLHYKGKCINISYTFSAFAYK